jgi:hypothetical protein
MAKARQNKQPSNPLTVIAALIGIVELAFAYPITKLSGTNQTIFVVFMVSFPVLLMSCFFLTVWFKPGHLYAPRDYANDQSFLGGIGRVPALPVPRAIPPPEEPESSADSSRGTDAGRESVGRKDDI